MANPLVDKIRTVVAPAVEGAGYELVDVEWKREQQVGWVCRVFIDRTDGTKVSHTDCERVSRELSAVLDVNDVIPQAYSLEVSSPGLDRPLRSLEHFRRFVGQTARVRLREGLAGRRNFRGRILEAVEPGNVTIEVDGQKFVLPLADLDSANLAYDFDQQFAKDSGPKKGQ